MWKKLVFVTESAYKPPDEYQIITTRTYSNAQKPVSTNN